MHYDWPMSMPDDQPINGISLHCNILLNDNKSIPQSVLHTTQKWEQFAY